jgi:pyruvate/2-oxoglutarate dehydrogenase complex dihydrolipoamide dehydrogenase (E3) component
MDVDIAVIGAGAGGLAAARAGARRGLRTVLITDGPIGGDCTFTGCVPSKSLIEAAARGASFADALAAVRRNVAAIAATETADVLRGEGVEALEGRARFRAPRALDVDGQAVRAGRVVVATGARPAVAAIEGLNVGGYLTNETVFELACPPRSLVVLGGGAIGCELTQAFARLGCAVTIIEALPRLVAREEPEASAVLVEVFAGEGIDVRTDRQVTRAEGTVTGATRVWLDDGDAVTADEVLVAVGRHADTDGLDLEAAGIALNDRGFIRTDDHLATSAAGVYAVGDVAGTVQFTHAADEMGRLAVANAFRHPGMPRRRFQPAWIPAVTYTSPEIGRVGMTEAEAAEADGRVAFVPMSEVDRAVVAGQTAGFVKLIAGPRPVIRNVGGGRVLGATVVAERGGELVHEAVLAMRTRMFAGRRPTLTRSRDVRAAARARCLSGCRCCRSRRRAGRRRRGPRQSRLGRDEQQVAGVAAAHHVGSPAGKVDPVAQVERAEDRHVEHAQST